MADLAGMDAYTLSDRGTWRNIPVSGNKPKIYYFNKFFVEIDIRDVLDAITAIFSVFSDMYQPHIPKQWISAVDRIFQEEHLAYRVDPQGTVYPLLMRSLRFCVRMAWFCPRSSAHPHRVVWPGSAPRRFSNSS
jgi:hypothetical protein